MSLDYKMVLSNIFLFVLIVFPYFTFVKNSSDLQPWPLILSSLGIIFFLIKDKFLVNKRLKILFFFFLYALFYFLFLLFRNNLNFIFGIHALAGYFSVFIFSYIGYKTFSFVKVKTYLFSVVVWLYIAFAQILFGASIVAPFLSRFSTGGYRGLNALSPEPSFYAALCMYLLVFNEIFYLNKKYKTSTYILIFLAIILQIILSYSGVGIMFLGLFGVSKSIEFLFIKESILKKRLAFGAIVIIIFSMFLFVRGSIFGSTRGGEILKNSINNPILLLTKDLSVSLRLMNPVIGVYGGIIETHGLGFGPGSQWGENAPDWISKLLGQPTKFGGRILGGLVGSIYELGLMGVVFTGFIFSILMRSILKNKYIKTAFISSFLVIFVPIFMFGSVAFPLFGYIIGVHLLYLEKEV